MFPGERKGTEFVVWSKASSTGLSAWHQSSISRAIERRLSATNYTIAKCLFLSFFTLPQQPAQCLLFPPSANTAVCVIARWLNPICYTLGCIITLTLEVSNTSTSSPARPTQSSESEPKQSWVSAVWTSTKKSSLPQIWMWWNCKPFVLLWQTLSFLHNKNHLNCWSGSIVKCLFKLV